MPTFGENETESVIEETELCETGWFQKDIDAFDELIEEWYAWAPSLDNLPAAKRIEGEVDYASKIPLGHRKVLHSLGMADKHATFINNHSDLTVKLGLAANSTDTYNVVGFEVEARSIDHEQ